MNNLQLSEYPADPESRIRSVQNSVAAYNDRQKPQKKHPGKSFVVVKSFFLLFSQRKHCKKYFEKGSTAAATMNLATDKQLRCAQSRPFVS